jgi:hypothetical protein
MTSAVVVRAPALFGVLSGVMTAVIADLRVVREVTRPPLLAPGLPSLCTLSLAKSDVKGQKAHLEDHSFVENGAQFRAEPHEITQPPLDR